MGGLGVRLFWPILYNTIAALDEIDPLLLDSALVRREPRRTPADPWKLSGGMQQRVAIARALASRPALMLMDEPLASVDAQTRLELEDLVRQVRRDHGTTVLLVTHDIDESVHLGDRVIVLSRSPGSIVADIPIDLPAERDRIATRESPTFVALRGEVARLLHDRERQWTCA